MSTEQLFAITHLGDGAVLIPVGLMMVLLLCASGTWRVALRFGLAAIVCGGVVVLAKVSAYGCRGHLSIPAVSGHVVMSMLVYGTLGLLVLRSLPRAAGLAIGGGLGAFLAVLGGTRTAVGAHALIDVLCGFAVGGIGLLYISRGREEPMPLRRGITVLTVAIIVVVVFYGRQLYAEELFRSLGQQLNAWSGACS